MVNENYNELAAAVINQAFRDLTKVTYCSKPKQVPKVRASAREFLLEANEDLSFWCSLADLDMMAIVEKSREVVKLWDSGQQINIIQEVE